MRNFVLQVICFVALANVFCAFCVTHSCLLAKPGAFVEPDIWKSRATDVEERSCLCLHYARGIDNSLQLGWLVCDENGVFHYQFAPDNSLALRARRSLRHSLRRTAIGSAFAARLAGIRQAARVAARKRIGTRAKVARSHG